MYRMGNVSREKYTERVWEMNRMRNLQSGKYIKREMYRVRNIQNEKHTKLEIYRMGCVNSGKYKDKKCTDW